MNSPSVITVLQRALLRAACGIPLLLCSAISVANESAPVVATTAEILDALKRPSGLPTRSAKPANEDAPSGMCDLAQESAARTRTGMRGELLTRNLFVESAPSIDLDVRFDFGSSSVSAAGRQQLDLLASAMSDRNFASAKFAVAGHTDAKGSRADNDKLSCERSMAVKFYLVSKHGVAPDRLIAFGFGFSKLKLPAEPRSHENRRVEIRKSDG